MKTIFIFLMAAAPVLTWGQSAKKDFTEKELIKNKRVLDFSTEMQTTPKQTADFLKCVKNESQVKQYKQLPFFTGELPLIVPKRIKQHNGEMWEAIHEECKQTHLFVIK